MSLLIRGSRGHRPLLPALLFLPLLLVVDARGQEIHTADAVERFTPAYGAAYGAEWFPGNVLGPPDTSARPDIPATDPRQVLALGLGGEIVLRFDRAPITDRPGADVAVFENPFRYRRGGGDRVYAEPAEVAVSNDGVTWYTFPYDSTTLAGCAGVTPTDGSHSPLDSKGGGDRFDLATLGLGAYGVTEVRYLRLRDVTAIIRSDTAHHFYDFTLNGFDLDAVVNLSARPDAGVRESRHSCTLLPALSSDGTATLRLAGEGRVRCRLFGVTGELIDEVYNGRVGGLALVALRSRGAGLHLVRIEWEDAPPVTLRWSVLR